MPIGKNAIKRVANNGYSNVKSSSPDMENSVVEQEAEQAMSVAERTAPEKKPVPKKTPKAEAPNVKEKKLDAPKVEEKKADAPKKAPTKKAAPKKSLESEPALSPVNTAKTVVGKKEEASKRTGDGYVNLGGELPYYLL